MSHALFGSAADRYDLHTPPHHYQHDHTFVLSRLPKPSSRVLDVGCGTGVFLEKAIAAGFDATGIDASPEMISLASQRVGSEHVKVARMQDLNELEVYDAIVSLCWSFNYVTSFHEAEEVLGRLCKALKPGGLLILQIAHAPNASGLLNEDREPGPNGETDDVIFLYRFSQENEPFGEMRIQYVYGSKSLSELVFEEHRLHAADAHKVGELAGINGFEDIVLLDSWRAEPLNKSVNAFLLARRRQYLHQRG